MEFLQLCQGKIAGTAVLKAKVKKRIIGFFLWLAGDFIESLMRLPLQNPFFIRHLIYQVGGR